MTTKQRFKHLANKYYYDADRANEKIDFIQEYCSHIEGHLAGQPLIMDQFQIDDIIKPVFGLTQSKGGTRLINQVYIEIPRKNGKTTLLAAIELAHLFNDGEPGAQIYNCAGDDNQASLLFRIAKAMVLTEPRLSKNAACHQAQILYKNSFIKKITSKADTKHGFNSHAWIYDELHVARDDELYNTLKTSTGQRREPIGWMITTAGTNKDTICWNRHRYTQKIMDGSIEDDNFWGVIYSAPENADPYKQKTWQIANPLYKKSPTLQRAIKTAAQEAKNDTTQENAFKRLHLNIWTGSHTAWIKDSDWIKNKTALPDLDGSLCFGGLDLASVSDLNAFTLVFPLDGKFYIKPFFWMPEAKLTERDKRDTINYWEWVKTGHLKVTPGNVTDYNIIKEDILSLSEKYQIGVEIDDDKKYGIAFDRWNSSQLVTDLVKEGLIFTGFGQGFASMSAPSKEFEREVLKGNILHDGHPVLRWNLANVMLSHSPSGDIKPDKKASEEKIDGVVATIMAFGEYMTYKAEDETTELYIDIW